MMEHRINENMLEQFRQIMMEEEKSAATLEKYVRDVKGFLQFAKKDGYINKDVC